MNRATFWLGVIFIVGTLVLALESCAMPVVTPPCEGDPPACNYGDRPACWCQGDECKWYCVPDRDRFSEAQTCDPDCDPDDPICIPCDLEFSSRDCTTICIPHPYLGTICRTVCSSVS